MTTLCHIKIKSFEAFLSISIVISFVYSTIILIFSGIGWDAPGDLISANIFMNLSSELTLNESYEAIPATSEFYGFFIYQISDFIVNSILGLDYQFIPTLDFSYKIISFINYFLSFFSILYLGYALYILTGFKKIIMLYVVLLQTSPLWIGMQIVNFKDVPVASGIILIIASLTITLKKIDFNFIHIIILYLGSIIAFNTRAGLLPMIISLYVLFSLLFIFLIVVFRNLLNVKTLILKLIFVNTLGLYILYLVTKVLNPIARINFKVWLIDSINVSLNFPSIQPLKTMGVDLMSNNLPWWYIPAWIFAQTPVLLFGMILVSIGSLITFLNKKLEFIQFGILVYISLIIPLIFIFTNLNLYNGIRHILFIYPIIISLVAINYYRSNLKMNVKNAIFIGIIMLNLFDSYRWLPYNYAFINPVAGLKSDKRNWDLDYWGVSAKEGISNLKKLTNYRPIFVLPDGSSSIPYGGVKKTEQISRDTYAMYVYIHWNHKLLEEKCKIVNYIKRDSQVLGMGGICIK